MTEILHPLRRLSTYLRYARAPAVLVTLVCVLMVVVPAEVTGSSSGHGAGGSAGHRVPTGDAVWPLRGTPAVVRPFAPPPEPWRAGHRGVDLGAAPGEQVLSAAPGTVLYAGPLAGRGVVSIRHHGGLRTTYEPVQARLAVGERVAAGQLVGALVPGHPGCPQPACLHWGLRDGEGYLDPLSLLGHGRVRLLPARDTAAAARSVAVSRRCAPRRHGQSTTSLSTAQSGTSRHARRAVATVASMTKARQAVGAYGERLAARYLADAGFLLLDRNWRSSSGGELDILAQDGDTLVVFEVKTRRGPGFGAPAEAVDARKVTQLRRLASEWLASRSLRYREVRFDVLEVVAPPRGRPRVHHVRGVC